MDIERCIDTERYMNMEGKMSRGGGGGGEERRGCVGGGGGGGD